MSTSSKYTKLISLRVIEENLEELKKIASARQTSVASIIRLAIFVYIEETKEKELRNK